MTVSWNIESAKNSRIGINSRKPHKHAPNEAILREFFYVIKRGKKYTLSSSTFLL